MMLVVELVIIGIALGVFILQHRIKQRISIVSSKLVYWTTMIFASIGLNIILYGKYPDYYQWQRYATVQLLVGMTLVIVGYVLLQILAPSQVLKKWFKKKTAEEQQDPDLDSYIKEMHFETFLETICWLAFMVMIISQVMFQIIGSVVKDVSWTEGMMEVVCFMMMVTIPIGVRQIGFYLYRIKGIKDEEDITEIEMKFHKKLKNQHYRL